MKRQLFLSILLTGIVFFPSGCKQPGAAASAPAGMQALPVQTQSVALSPVQQSSDFVATIKSRRSVTVMPQVDGNLTQLLVCRATMFTLVNF